MNEIFPRMSPEDVRTAMDRLQTDVSSLWRVVIEESQQGGSIPGWVPAEVVAAIARLEMLLQSMTPCSNKNCSHS